MRIPDVSSVFAVLALFLMGLAFVAITCDNHPIMYSLTAGGVVFAILASVTKNH